MTRYYLSRSGLLHRVGNLHPGALACGKDHRDMTPLERIPTNPRPCLLCWRIGGRP